MKHPGQWTDRTRAKRHRRLVKARMRRAIQLEARCMNQCMRRRIGYRRIVFADGPTSSATIHVMLPASSTGNVERVQADLAARVGPGIHAVHVERAEPPGPNDHGATVIGGAARRARSAHEAEEAAARRCAEQGIPRLTDEQRRAFTPFLKSPWREAQTVLDAIEARDTPALTDALAAMREQEDAG